jgi:tetraacyldisaccharide 4'-kinase
LTRQGARAGVPVICVGNPTVGGAGKTPAALTIARLLIAAGRAPVLVSRGYGGRLAGPVRVDSARHTARDVGDEPLLLARAAPTIVARDRRAGAAAAIAAGSDVIVMDDGFQNPSLAKNWSLLVVNAARGIGNGRVLPAGPLRAPLAEQLARADALVVVGDGDAARPVVAAAATRGVSVLTARLMPEPSVLAAIRDEKVLAFAGIGDPGRFFATLNQAGVTVAARRAFGDHHRYTAAEAAELNAQAARGDLLLVTTEKDMARIEGDPAAAPLAKAVALPVTLVFDDAAALRGLLAKAIRPRAS